MSADPGPRFVVATVHGDRLPSSGGKGMGPGSSPPGLSASVIDRSRAGRMDAELAVYRSEDRWRHGRWEPPADKPGGGGGRRTRGVEGALAAAEEHAARLNLKHGPYIVRCDGSCDPQCMSCFWEATR